MQQITFTCETITPMFLAGGDGTTPELRPPSIKGALRFWWRPMNGHLTNLQELETKIFGGTAGDSGRRSSFNIRIIKDFDKSDVKDTLGENKDFVSRSQSREAGSETPSSLRAGQVWHLASDCWHLKDVSIKKKYPRMLSLNSCGVEI